MRAPVALVALLVAVLAAGLAHAADPSPKTFRLWVFSDAHVGTDQQHGRESLAIALKQSESPSGFAWDIALDLGDMSGAQGTPKDPAEFSGVYTTKRPFPIDGTWEAIPSASATCSSS
jgi:hypothetical protein